MKKLFKLISLLTLGLFFVACGDSASEGFTKSGKAGSLAVTYSSAKPLVELKGSGERNQITQNHPYLLTIPLIVDCAISKTLAIIC